jgi:serine/threonine protein kinase
MAKIDDTQPIGFMTGGNSSTGRTATTYNTKRITMPFTTSIFAQTGRFTDIRQINKGAYGRVYYSKDTTLARDVAVKELLPSLRTPELRIKFEIEARMQASRHHPNIITVYDRLEDPQTHELYLVCEYANGGSLADHLRKHGSLSQEQAIKVALDICAALEVMENRQIVHRDVKPGNILLFTDDQGQIVTAKLGDFGIARDNTAPPSTEGAPLGTWQYVAPEQRNGTQPLDVRTDILPLGLTLWEMLTGEIYREIQGQPGGPTDLQTYNPQGSLNIADITAIIQRAIQDEPDDRYQSPQTMESDLRDVLAHKSLDPAPTTPMLAVTARVSTSAPPTTRTPAVASMRGTSLMVRIGIAALILLPVISAAFLFLPDIVRSIRDPGDGLGTLATAIGSPTPIQLSTTAPTLTQQLTSTPEPTKIPSVTPTPIDMTKPEGVTAAFLDAWNKEDFDEVRRLHSQYSFDAFELKREEVTFNRTGTMTYEISLAEPITGVSDTVRVPVTFSSSSYLPDCCVLRKENGEWRINWGAKVGGNGESSFQSLLDFQRVKSPLQTMNGLGVRPVKVLRFSESVRIYFELENAQDKCVHVGMSGTIAIIYFDAKKAYVDGKSVFKRRYSTASGDGYVYVTVPRTTDTFPTSAELLDWQWTNTGFDRCVFGTGPKWSYVFNLEY